jgi:hypothetical protein
MKKTLGPLSRQPFRIGKALPIVEVMTFLPRQAL